MSGLFGSLMGAVESMEGGTAPGANNLVSELLSSAGGVQGVMSKLTDAGLGDKVQSWVGNGQNLQLAESEVLKVFPPDQLEALAEKHGVPQGMVAGLLAHALPQAVDQATPDGTAPAADASGSTDQGWA
jgi:uncharacterized protein YidB (DUF937 family)